MNLFDALVDFPVGKKAYLLTGATEGVRAALRMLIEVSDREVWYVYDVADLDRAVTGLYIIGADVDVEDIEPYLKMPKTGCTYVVLDDDANVVRRTALKSAFKGQTVIDCSDPTTPKPRASTLAYVQQTLHVAPPVSLLFCQRADWDTGRILHGVELWKSIAPGQIAERQALPLLDTILPPEPENVFVEAVMGKAFHKIPVDVEPQEVMMRLSRALDKVRILQTVLPENTTSVLLAKSGLTQDELRVHLPWAKSLKAKEVQRFGAALAWCYTRKDSPQIIEVLVSLLAKG